MGQRRLPRSAHGWIALVVLTLSSACGSSTPSAPSSSSVRAERLWFERTTVAGGARIGANVAISAPAPVGGGVVSLQSTDGAAQAPASVTILQGDTTASFVVTTRPVDSPRDVTLTASAGGASATASLGLTEGSFLVFTSEPGDPVGRGSSRGYVIDTATFQAGALFDLNTVRVTLEIRDPSLEFWMLEISAPRGQRLTSGAYQAAVRSVARVGSQPGLDFSAAGRGCEPLTGRFDVIEAEYGGPSAVFGVSTINRFRARFVQRCDAQSAALTGEVRILMNPWR